MSRKAGTILPKTLEMVGKKYGMLTVLEIISVPYEGTKARCLCECGVIAFPHSASVKCGNTLSCGCFMRAEAKRVNTHHGGCGTRAYQAWSSARNRIYNKNGKDWRHYGGRGLQMQESWNDFAVFHAEMGDPPPGLELERRENDIGYFKINCYWATRKQENNNKRNNVKMTLNGVTKNLGQWAEDFGISRSTIADRRRQGWSDERAITTPVVRQKHPSCQTM